MLARRVELHLARRSFDGMPVQDGNSPARPAREFFQPLAQVYFLGRKQFAAESTNLPEHRGFHKNERAGHQPPPAADKIPKLRDETGHE